MAKISRTLTSLRNWVKVFILETLAVFGLVTLLRAAMVPPALSLVFARLLTPCK